MQGQDNDLMTCHCSQCTLIESNLSRTETQVVNQVHSLIVKEIFCQNLKYICRIRILNSWHAIEVNVT
jgi:hypothetical protein